MEPHPPAMNRSKAAHTAPFSPHTVDSTSHGVLVERRSHHEGGGHDAFRERGQIVSQPGPPLQLSTRRLQVFSYVLAELSSATTLLPDYTKAILNLSRRLVGAWQSVTAAAVARTRYEHALVWAAHQCKSTEPSALRVSSSAKTTLEGCRVFGATLRRSLHRQARAKKKRRCSVPVTAAAATSSLSPSATASLFGLASSSHKRRRLTREATPAAASVDATAVDRIVEKPPPHSNAPSDDGPLGPPNVGSPRSSSKQRRVDVTATSPSPSLSDRRRGVRHDRAAHKRRHQFVQRMLQQLWLDAQEAEDKAGQHVEYIRALVVNALYQQYLQVTVEASYHDLALYRWLSPLLLSAYRGGLEAGGQEWFRHGRHLRHRSALAHPESGSLQRARQHQAAVQVVADLRLLLRVLGRARISASPSRDTRVYSGGDDGDSGVVIASLATENRSSPSLPVPPPTTTAQGGACSEDCASFATVGGVAAAVANSEGSNSDGASARWTASADGSRGSSELSPSDGFDDHTLAVPMLLQSFLQACLSFDPTHCAFTLMSRCVVLAQHVRCGDDEQTVSSPATPGGKGARQKVHSGVGRVDEGVADGVDGEEPPREHFGLFYVVIARRAVGACACTAMCFGNHKFIFVCCHDTEVLLRGAMMTTESNEGVCEGSEASTAATVEEEERHFAHVSRLSAKATATASTSNETSEGAEKLAGDGARAEFSASTSSTLAMTATIKGRPSRFHLSCLHPHRPRMDKSTPSSRVRGISALKAHDVHRLKRSAKGNRGGGGGGLVGEVGSSRGAPPSPHRSAPPSGVLQSTPSRQPYSLTPPFFSPESDEVTPTATTAGRGVTLGVAALSSSIATAKLWERSVTRQVPSPHVKRASTQALLATQDPPSTDSASAAAPCRGYTAANTVPTSPASTQGMVTDISSVAPVSGASLQSRTAGEGSTSTCPTLGPLLREATSVFPEDDAVADEEGTDSEYSCASAPNSLHKGCSRYVVNGRLATHYTGSATRLMSNSELFSCQTSSSTPLSFSSSVADTFSDSEEEEDADAVDRGRHLQPNHGLTTEHRDRIPKGDDEGGTAEDATVEDSDDVFSGGGSPVFVVMHSPLCSCGVEDMAKESGRTAASATTASPSFTATTTPDFFEPSHLRQYQSDMPLGDSIKGLSRLFSVSYEPYMDFPFLYFEQRVLLPPGSGHERRVGGRRSGGDGYTVAHSRSPLVGSGRMSPSRTSPSARAAEAVDTQFGGVCTRAHGTDVEAAAVAHEVTVTVQDADVPLMGAVASTTPDPERDEQCNFAHEKPAGMPKGTSSCHPQHALCAADTSAVEPSEGDLAYAAELYARLQFWSLRGQDRSAYIDSSWSQQLSHVRPEGAEWTASSASPSLAGNVEDLEGRAEFNGQEPTAPWPSHTTGVDAPRRVHHGMSHGALGAGERGKLASGAILQSSLNSSVNTSEADEVSDIIRLPFRLLHCTVGTVEFAEEAELAVPRAGARVRKRRRAARAEGRQTKRRPTAAEDRDTTEEEEDDPSGKEEPVCAEERERFPHLPSFMTVNARGKELLFEALRESTEVVVCGVRESRAHTGYHDVLHQRCPSQPLSTPMPTVPETKASVCPEGDANNVGYAPRACAVAVATSGTPLKSTWVTAVSPWTVATAAVQGCSFRVATGTLSRDERNPFAFDTHRHLGARGIVCWSQGNISHEEEDGNTPMDASGDETVMTMAAPAGDSASHGVEGATGGATHHRDHMCCSDSSHMPKWRWPRLPANDHKQWRCELLKSEFRLARSRCLDCLLVDHTHGRPIAAITLAPRSWTQTSFGSALDAAYSDDCDGIGEKTLPRRCAGRRRADTKATDMPSPQDVVQRTTYVVIGFTHYVAPLWRHLREEKAVLVDMDRTLIDNAITVRSAAERQRHLRHVHRVVEAADGVAGAANPCVLWRRPTAATSSALFADAPFRVGRNDAPQLTAEELAESMARGVDEQQESVLYRSSSRGHHHHHRSFSSSNQLTETVEDNGVLRPTIRQRPLHSRQSAPSHTPATAGNTSAFSSGGLLHCFMRRTASQRQSLGIVHYEECGAIKYDAGSLPASDPGLGADSSFKSGPNHSRRTCESDDTESVSSASSTDEDALRLSYEKSAATSATTATATAAPTAAATPPTRYFFDVVYVRPGVRQFLYRAATQWNIPVVLVTKSSRSRTEAILRQVLDPHRVLFPDMRSSVVTADEMLHWCDGEAVCHDAADRGKEACREADVGFGDPVGRLAVHQSSSAASRSPDAAKAYFAPPHTTEAISTAERIARSRKGALRVVQFVLDAAAMTAARHAWRAPAWCDWPNRLPKPRSIAVLDDAPQVWEESDWRCTVHVAPYTLSRVDPRAYFSRRGYATSLVLSCLYGSKCLVCGEGVLCLPERQGTETETSSSSPHSPSTSLSGPESRELRAYRWPHCVCVCPPDHLRDIARTEEGVPVGYTSTSYGAATASDLSASARAILRVLLWRMSGKAAVCSSQKPLLLPSIEDSATTEQARGGEGHVGARCRGYRRRRRHRCRADDLDATMAPVSEEWALTVSATADREARRRMADPATVARTAASRHVGMGTRPRYFDTFDTEGIASPPSSSLSVFSSASSHTFASASTSERSALTSLSSSPPRTSSSSSSTTTNLLSSGQFAWGPGFGHAAVNATPETGSYTPSTMVTVASMPPTPMAFRASPDLSLEFKALGGEAEADDDEQHGLVINAGNLSANTTTGSRNAAGEEGSVLQAPAPEDYAVATTTCYGAPRSNSSEVDNVIPLEMRAAPSVLGLLRAPGSPSHWIDDVGGAHAMGSEGSAMSSADSYQSSWLNRSFTFVPAEDVVPIISAPETFTEGVVANVDDSVPLEAFEAPLQRPRRWRLDDPSDEVEDVIPL
nr:unnamed protein product [Leishmania braziliensis]